MVLGTALGELRRRIWTWDRLVAIFIGHASFRDWDFDTNQMTLFYRFRSFFWVVTWSCAFLDGRWWNL
jgi:hypothetical protein